MTALPVEPLSGDHAEPNPVPAEPGSKPALYETGQPFLERVAVVLEKGRRVTMEDFACSGRLGPEVHFHAVFDGHGGANIARHLSRTLPLRVLQYLRAIDLEDQAAVTAALYDTFLTVDQELYSQPEFAEIREEGSTAAAVLTVRRRLYFVNLGDSRAVLFQGANILHATQDHTPGLPGERERVEAAGGWVRSTNDWGRPGPARVNGVLAVARAFGDASLKRTRETPLENGCDTPYPGPAAMVTAAPTVTVVEQTDPAVLALASDGLWGVIDNGLFATVFAQCLAMGDDLLTCCQNLVKTALLKGSSDNVTLLAVRIGADGGPSKKSGGN